MRKLFVLISLSLSAFAAAQNFYVAQDLGVVSGSVDIVDEPFTIRAGAAATGGSNGFTTYYQATDVFWATAQGFATDGTTTWQLGSGNDVDIPRDIYHDSSTTYVVGSHNNLPAIWTFDGTSWTLHNMTPPGGYFYGRILKTNGVQSVGTANGQAFIWTGLDPNGTPLLNGNCALDLSATQQVGFGYGGAGGYIGYLWNGPSQSPIQLDGTALGMEGSTAEAIDGEYQYGYIWHWHSDIFFTEWHAARWHGTAASVENLEPAGGGNFSEILGARSGVQVGHVNLRAARWLGTANSFLNLSEFLPGGGFFTSVANSVDDQGNIYGFAALSGSGWHAIVWHPAVNHPPIANAGPDQVVQSQGQFTNIILDGTASSDPENQPLHYVWTEGATVIGDGAEIYYPVENGVGHHVYTLTVNDPYGGVSSDTVNVDIVDAPPTVYLNGASDMTIAAGSAFVDPGASAYDATDGWLPVTVSGTVNTSVAGTYTLVYSAVDSSQHVASATRTVHVVYFWPGFNQPVNMDNTSIFKLGSTVPLKFSMAHGPQIARVYIAKVSNGIVGTELEAVTNVTADAGNTFRLSSGNYAFNWSTAGLSTGTWQVRVDLGDGNGANVVLVSLK